MFDSGESRGSVAPHFIPVVCATPINQCQEAHSVLFRSPPTTSKHIYGICICHVCKFCSKNDRGPADDATTSTIHCSATFILDNECAHTKTMTFLYHTRLQSSRNEDWCWWHDSLRRTMAPVESSWVEKGGKECQRRASFQHAHALRAKL